MSNIDFYKGEIDRYEKAIAVEEKKETWKKVAEELHGIYAAYTDAGFSEEQAWYIVTKLLNKSLYDD